MKVKGAPLDSKTAALYCFGSSGMVKDIVAGLGLGVGSLEELVQDEDDSVSWSRYEMLRIQLVAKVRSQYLYL